MGASNPAVVTVAALHKPGRASDISPIAQYEAYRQAVSDELKAAFAGRQGMLYGMLRYHLGWNDEHGQPLDVPMALHLPGALALAVCEGLSGDYAAALPAAAGVELVHNFTLVHGEVQAGRLEAQDRPSIWWVWGPAQAINAGDGLHALGRVVVMKLSQRGVPPERTLKAVETLDRACLDLCEGQYLDLTFRDQLMVTTNDYLGMVRKKTGGLASCAAYLGALAAGESESGCAGFGEVGARLGMAWQIMRDVQDLWGERGDGMTSSNIVNKKKSLPLIHALESATPAEKRELGNVYMKRVLEPEDTARVTAILDGAGSRGFATGQAEELVGEALNELGAGDAGRERWAVMEEVAQAILAGQF